MKLKFFLISFLFFNISVFSEVIEEIYFIVNNNIITKMDFERQKKNTLKDPAIKKNLGIDNYDHFIISNMIVNHLIKQEAIRTGIFISGVDVTNQINRMVNSNGLKDIETLKRYLEEREGIDFDFFYESQENSLYVQSFVGRSIFVQEPTEIEIRNFYKKNKEKFLIKEDTPLYSLSVIFFEIIEGMGFLEQKAIKKQAQKVLDRLRNKKISFEEAVSKYSDDISSKGIKGDLGWIILLELGRTEKRKIEVLQKAKKGSITPIISTPNGFYLYKVKDIKTDGLVPYKKASVIVKNIIISEKKKKIFDEKIDFLFKQAILKQKTQFFTNLKLPYQSF